MEVLKRILLVIIGSAIMVASEGHSLTRPFLVSSDADLPYLLMEEEEEKAFDQEITFQLFPSFSYLPVLFHFYLEKDNIISFQGEWHLSMGTGSSVARMAWFEGRSLFLLLSRFLDYS